MQSHPTWVRGLKLVTDMQSIDAEVAPYVGAWIETDKKLPLIMKNMSHPTWVRGLKHLGFSIAADP